MSACERPERKGEKKKENKTLFELYNLPAVLSVEKTWLRKCCPHFLSHSLV